MRVFYPPVNPGPTALPSEPPESFISANGHAPSIAGLIAYAGAALLWGSVALFAPAQPVAQAAQYGYGTSNTRQAGQSSGSTWGQAAALIPPDSVPSQRISAAPQVDPFQLQPVIFKPQPAGLHLGKTLTAFQQVDPAQTQPRLDRQAPAALIDPGPFGIITARPQIDPTQIQPDLPTYPHAGVVEASPPPRPIITASPQIAERQLRGFVQVYGHVGAWLNYMEFVYGRPPVDPTQTDAKLFRYPHAAAAVVTSVPTRQIVARAQENPSQIQPIMAEYPHAGATPATVPVRPMITASPQGYQTQTQPEIFGQIPAGLHLGKTLTSFPVDRGQPTAPFMEAYPHAVAVLASPPLRPMIYARGYGAQEYEQPAPVIHAGGLAPFATAPIQIVRLQAPPIGSIATAQFVTGTAPAVSGLVGSLPTVRHVEGMG